MPGYSLMGEDSAVRITLGQTATGALPVYGTAVSIEGTCRRWRVRDSVEKTNVKAIGNARKRFRYHSGETSIEVSNFVPSTGWVAGAACLGKYAKFEVKPLGSMVAYTVYEGVIESWEASGGSAEEQSEDIVISCDADYATV